MQSSSNVLEIFRSGKIQLELRIKAGFQHADFSASV